ncbi:MAG TPA: hypothetical protein VEB68_10025 [Croceibacterium sp.]|nr:hypothetical protein [Croceibacterium sp.]
MKFGKIAQSALVAASLAFAPVAAQAAATDVRVSSPVEGEELSRTGMGIGIAAIVVILVLLIMESDSGENPPVSA